MTSRRADDARWRARRQLRGDQTRLLASSNESINAHQMRAVLRSTAVRRDVAAQNRRGIKTLQSRSPANHKGARGFGVSARGVRDLWVRGLASEHRSAAVGDPCLPSPLLRLGSP
jgi:hypothetical protein